MLETTIWIVNNYGPTAFCGMLTLGDQSVEILVVGPFDVQVAATDIVDSLVINHERTIGVLKSGVSSQDGVVGLDNRCRYLRRRVDREF